MSKKIRKKRAGGRSRETKTLRNAKVIEVVFVKDESLLSVARITEAKNLIAQMIELAHKRGRPARKKCEEDKDAA